MTNRRSFLKALPSFAIMSAGAPFSAYTQTDSWPARPIRLIVPSSPGSGSDIATRAFGQYLHSLIKQPVYVENRPGGNTIVGTETVKSSAPDGYTFLCSSASTHSANPALYSQLSYDPPRDFAEIGQLGKYPYLAIVKEDSPYQSLQDLVEAARKSPGEISFGYGGSSSQLPGELLKVQAKVDILNVPYRAAPQVMNDIAGGVIDFSIITAMSGTGGVQNGKLRAIGVTSAERLPEMPDVPTFTETYPDFVYEGWIGLSAPIGTPAIILEQLNQALRDAIDDPGMRAVRTQLGLGIQAFDLAEYAWFVAEDRRRFVEMVELAKIAKVN
jgi:tripartite-type tricarboxylate transporter receptor subunit TctC